MCSKPVLNACRRELGNRRSVSEEDVPVQEAVDRLVEEFVNSDALEDAMSDGNFYVKLNALTNMADLPGYRGEENQAKVSEALELAQRWSSPITGVLVPADSVRAFCHWCDSHCYPFPMPNISAIIRHSLAVRANARGHLRSWGSTPIFVHRLRARGADVPANIGEQEEPRQ